MEPTNNQNFTGMNVAKLQQEKMMQAPKADNTGNGGNGNIGKVIIAIIIIAILAMAGYLGWNYYKKDIMKPVSSSQTATTTVKKATIATTTSSIDTDLDAALNINVTRELELIEGEF